MLSGNANEDRDGRVRLLTGLSLQFNCTQPPELLYAEMVWPLCGKRIEFLSVSGAPASSLEKRSEKFEISPYPQPQQVCELRRL